MKGASARSAWRLHLDGARGMGVGGELRIVGGHERVGGHRTWRTLGLKRPR